ncbi:hypothetical protein AC1031_017507 [Aphanomyces cochlioides]|nr:hypothetical protein AC1031_017507 [Aphanomyces cochlioides]
MSDHKFAVQAAMAGTAVLLVKHVVTVFFGAAAKFKAGSRAPEDTADGKQSFGVADADPKDETLKAAKLLQRGRVIVFTAARIGHTVAYANALAIPRSIAYLTGLVSVLTIAGAGVVAVLKY